MNNIVFLVFGLAAVFIAYKSFQSYQEYRHNNTLPVLNINAVVIDKMYKDNNPIPIEIELNDIEDYKNRNEFKKIPDTFLVAFKNLQTSEEIHFDVKEEEYERMQKDQKGILKYQGTRFHNFEIK